MPGIKWASTKWLGKYTSRKSGDTNSSLGSASHAWATWQLWAFLASSVNECGAWPHQCSPLGSHLGSSGSLDADLNTSRSPTEMGSHLQSGCSCQSQQVRTPIAPPVVQTPIPLSCIWPPSFRVPHSIHSLLCSHNDPSKRLISAFHLERSSCPPAVSRMRSQLLSQLTGPSLWPWSISPAPALLTEVPGSAQNLPT